MKEVSFLNSKARLPAAQFKLFDYVGDLFKTMGISVWAAFSVRYHKKSCPLEKQDFIGVDDISKVRQTTFEFFHIRDEHINYRRPGLSQRI